MELIGRIRSVLMEPAKFFGRIRKEKGVRHAFRYLAIIGVVSAVLGPIAKLYTDRIGMAVLGRFGIHLPAQPEPQIALAIVASYFGLLAVSFVGAGILHLWLLFFKGRKGYYNNYQLYAYSMTPSLLLGWIPFLGAFTWIYDFVLLVIGTKKIHGFSTKKAILVYLIPAAILWLLSVIVLLAVFNYHGMFAAPV